MFGLILHPINPIFDFVSLCIDVFGRFITTVSRILVSGDYWKINSSGKLEYDGDGWLKNEKGEFILDEKGNKIGAKDAGDGLNKIMGITNGKEITKSLLANWHSVQAAPSLNLNENVLMKYAPDIAFNNYVNQFGGYGGIPEDKIASLLTSKLGTMMTGKYVDNDAPTFRGLDSMSPISAIGSLLRGDHGPALDIYDMGLDKSPLMRSMLFAMSPDDYAHAADRLKTPDYPDGINQENTPGSNLQDLMDTPYKSLGLQTPEIELKIGVQDKNGVYTRSAVNKYVSIQEAKGLPGQKGSLFGADFYGDIIGPMLVKMADAKALNDVYLYTRQTDGQKYFSVYAPTFSGFNNNSLNFDYSWLDQKSLIKMYPNLVQGILNGTQKPYKSYK